MQSPMQEGWAPVPVSAVVGPSWRPGVRHCMPALATVAGPVSATSSASKVGTACGAYGSMMAS